MRHESLTYWLLGLAIAAASNVARAAEPTIETDARGVACPNLGATRSAVHERLAPLSLEGVGTWVARYTLARAPDSGDEYVVLVLRDATGAIRLERRIPTSGESCATVAQAIALVLERYFSSLQAPAPGGEGEPPATSVPTVAPAVPPLERPAAPLPETLAPAWQLALEGGLLAGSRTAVFGLELGGWFADWLYASLQPQLLLPAVGETIHDSTGRIRGTAEVLELPLRLSLALGRRRERWGWHVGPAVRLSLRHASSDALLVGQRGSDEPADTSATGWSLAAGAGAGLTYWVLPLLGLSASLALDAPITETQFWAQEPSGAGKTPLASTSPQAQVLLGVAFGASP